MMSRRRLMGISIGGSALPFPIDKIDAGTTTLATSSDIIQVSHNLGTRPDFACIYQDVSDWDDVAFGTCVWAIYYRIWQDNTRNTAKERYGYTWNYKHPTSGNDLGASSSMGSLNATDTIFKFLRGNANWATVDANGNTVTYHWMVGTFKR